MHERWVSLLTPTGYLIAAGSCLSSEIYKIFKVMKFVDKLKKKKKKNTELKGILTDLM